ncbi:MAG: hypothetical protein GEU73_02005 [Chloroflexi bacterium]|nr:hypothetical protein [Chloroflexota bacterium]
MTAKRGITRAVLLGVVFAHVATEAVLSPFYPRFFAEVFGVTDLSFTGYYIFACRLAVVLVLPLWGLAARWIPVRQLLTVGQAAAAAFTGALALVPTSDLFLGLSVALVAAKASSFLAYPLLVELEGGRDPRATIVRHGVVFHAAIVVSSVVGSIVVSLPQPTIIFPVLAVVDLAQLAACRAVLRPGVALPIRSPADTSTSHADHALVESNGGPLVRLAALVGLFHLSVNTVRPFFAEWLVADIGLSVNGAGILYLLPNLAALAALAGVSAVRCRFQPERALPGALIAAGVGLALQPVMAATVLLIAARLLFGAALSLAQMGLDLRLFAHRRRGLPTRYSVFAAAQNAGLLGAPLVATAAVASAGLMAPLAVGAFGCVLASAWAWMPSRSGAPIPKTIRAIHLWR